MSELQQRSRSTFLKCRAPCASARSPAAGATLPAAAAAVVKVTPQCEAALDFKLKLVAPFTQKQNDAYEEHKKFSTKSEDDLGWRRTKCEHVKAFLEELEALKATSEEVERVCGKKITAKVLKCDAKCWQTWIPSYQKSVAHDCKMYEEAKKDAAGK